MSAPADGDDLVVDDAHDIGEVLTALAEHLDLVRAGRHRIDRTFLDSFDGRVRAAGLTLERAGDALVLREEGLPDLEAAVGAARDDRVLVGEVAPGALRDRLTGLLDGRAVLPLARVRSTVEVHAVRNRDEKTVARVVVEQPTVMRAGQRSTALPTRIRVIGMRGYDRARARTTTLLRSHPGLQAGGALADEAAAAAGTRPPDLPDLGAGLQRAMPAAQAGLLVCRRLADVVEVNHPGTVADVDIEFLHDLRVAVRKSRSVLRELKAVLPAEGLDAQRRELKWIQAVTGPVRDLDVQLDEWPDDPRLEPLRRMLADRRQRALVAMRRALRGRRYREAFAAWRAYLDTPVDEGPPLDDVVALRIRRLYDRMAREGKAIDDDTPAEALHELRKRGKELRYLLELFGRLWPDDAVKPLVSSLKELQDVLGRHQDRHVQADELRAFAPDLAREPGGADALLTLGPMVERLEREQAAARARFADRFAGFAHKDVRRTVKATFR